MTDEELEFYTTGGGHSTSEPCFTLLKWIGGILLVLLITLGDKI